MPGTFLELAACLPEAMLALSAQGTIVAANAAAVRLLGVAGSGALHGRALHEFVADSEAEVHDYLRRCARSRDLSPNVLRVRGPGDAATAYRAEGAVLRPATPAQGTLLLLRLLPRRASAAEFVALNQRVDRLTEEVRRRQRAELALRREEARLRVTLASIGDGVITTDREARVTFLNGIAESLTGWDLSGARGRPIDEVFDIVQEGDGAPIANPVHEALRFGRIVNLANHAVLRGRTGGTRPIADSAAPIRDEGSEILGAVLVFRDVSATRQARRSLRHSEERYRALATSAAEIVWVTDADGRVVEDSPSWREFTGQTLAAFRGDGWLDAVHPEDRPRVAEAWADALAHTRLYVVEYRLRTAGGSYRWAAVRGTPVLDADGRVREWVGMCVDVHERREAALQIAEAGQLTAMRAAVSAALANTDVLEAGMRALVGELVQHLGIEMALAWVNAAGGEEDGERRPDGLDFHAGFGDGAATDQARALARSLALGREPEVAVADDAAPARHGVALAVRGRRVGSVVVDSTPALSLAARLELDAIADTVAAFIDRCHTRSRLLDSEARFRTLADNIAQFAWMADPTGWIFWYNRRWFDYTGTTLEEMQGWGWRKVHHPEHVDRVVARIQQAWDTGEPWEDTFPLRGRDGSYRWFLSRAIPIRDDTGCVLRWFGTNTDVTAQREAEEALRRADRRKDEFLATLAHELRNPLAPMRTSLEIAKRVDGDPATLGRLCERMDHQVAHLERLVDDLLDMSRITHDRLTLRRELVDLRELLAHLHDQVRASVVEEHPDLQLGLQLPAAPVMVEGDPVRLRQVIHNLLNNAVKSVGTQGHVDLALHVDAETAVVTVRDDGVGLPGDMLERIFDMFTQVDRPGAKAEGGLGIGLSLVRRLVALHGGNVLARSAGEGCGSEFEVRLPCARFASAEQQAPGVPPAPAGAHLRILVVDDNVDAADTLVLFLRLAGHTAVAVYDGGTALVTAETLRPEVVLLDLGLPRLDGYQVCRELRGRPFGRDVFVIAVTGWGQEQDRARTAAAGFDAHLLKPVDCQALLQVLADTRG
ncbi:MAG: PAS domain S-box protein [Planctomycetota bacterium]